MTERILRLVASYSDQTKALVRRFYRPLPPGEYIDIVVRCKPWKGNYKIISGVGMLKKQHGSIYIETEEMFPTNYDMNAYQQQLKLLG